MLFAFVITLLGLIFAIRIARRALADRTLTKSEVTKTGTLYLASLIGIIFLSHGSLFSLWALSFLPHAVFLSYLFILRQSRAKIFRSCFSETLQLTILKMKTGKSFRHALTEVIFESNSAMKQRLSEILDIVVFSQQEKPDFHGSFVDLIITEFKQVDQNPHAALRRLSNFRNRLQVEDDFRRKSGLILRQLRAQSLIMSGLYLAILIFITHEFGFSPHRTLILSSVLFFIGGLIWIQRGGRRMKWKV